MSIAGEARGVFEVVRKRCELSQSETIWDRPWGWTGERVEREETATAALVLSHRREHTTGAVGPPAPLVPCRDLVHIRPPDSQDFWDRDLGSESSGGRKLAECTLEWTRCLSEERKRTCGTAHFLRDLNVILLASLKSSFSIKTYVTSFVVLFCFDGEVRFLSVLMKHYDEGARRWSSYIGVTILQEVINCMEPSPSLNCELLEGKRAGLRGSDP